MMTSLFEVPAMGISAEDLADFALSHLLDFDQSLENVDQEVKKLRRKMEQGFRQQRPYVKLTNMPNRPGNFIEHRTTTNPIKTTPDGSRTLKCAFDLSEFKPEEINVAIDSKEHCIRIEANHDIKDEKGRHSVTRMYRRNFYLPEEAKVEDISKLELKSHLTNEGMLWMEAPLPKITKTEKEREMKEKKEARGNEPVPIEVKKM